MDNEFNKPIKESYNVDEFQVFDAVEYYKQKEIADSPAEVVKVPEQLDSTINNNRINQFEENNSYDKIEQKTDNSSKPQNQAQEKYQINQGGAEEVQVSSGAEVEAGSSTAATTSSAAASASTGSAVVASSASLAGVTILAAAAVAAVGSSAAIALPDPLVDLNTATYEVGTDYFVYDLDVKGLTSGIDYYIDVKEIDGTLIENFPISQDGHIRHIVSGLTPDTPYDIRLYTRDSTFHDLVYYTARCNTTYDTNPKAIFNMIPNIDYEMGVYSLDCEVYISDYTKVLSNSYLQMFVNDNPLQMNYRLEDNYYKFNIKNLRNEALVSGIAYGIIEGQQEQLIIGSYEYEIQFPKDFVFNEDRSFAEYTFDVSDFSYEFDQNLGGNLVTIYTGFNNIADPRDLYRISILDEDGEVITYEDTSEESVSLVLEPMYENVTVKLTLLKELEDDEIKELESEEVKYIIPNTFLSDISLSYDEYGIRLSGNKAEALADADIEYLIHMKDGTVLGPLNDLISEVDFSSYVELVGLGQDFNYLDIDYVEATVTNSDIKYGKYKTKPVEATVDTYEVLDNGCIDLDYKLELPQGATLVEIDIPSTNCQISEEIYSNIGLEGTLNILNLYSNKLNVCFAVTYEINGVKYTTISQLKYDFDVDVSLDWFGIYAYSGIYAYEKVNSTLDGKDVNNQFTVYAKVYNDYESIYEEKDVIAEASYRLGEYNALYFNSNMDSVRNRKLDYRIVLNDDEEVTGSMEYDSDGEFESDLTDLKYINYEVLHKQAEANSGQAPYYFKTHNADGTININIYTGFKDKSSYNLFEQIFITKESPGGNKTTLSEELTDEFIVLSNLEDAEYDLRLNVGFRDDDGNKWFGRDFFEIKEANPDEAVISDSESCSIESGPVTKFEFNTRNIFKDKTFNLKVLDELYPVEIISDYTDSRIVDGTDDSYEYELTYATYSVLVTASRDYYGFREFHFEISINDIEANDAELIYTYSPEFILEFISVSSVPELEEEKNVGILKYVATLPDKDSINIVLDDSTTYTISNLTFDDNGDSRDNYIIIAEWDRLMTSSDSSFSAEKDYYTLVSVPNLIAGNTYYQYNGDYYVPYVPTTNETDVIDYYEAIKVNKYEGFDSSETYYTHLVGSTGVLRYDSEANIDINALAVGYNNITLYMVELKDLGWYEYHAYDKIEIGKIE